MGIIRFLLALSVLVGHLGGIFGVQLVPPSIAVELFFIISGFYMALILSEKYTSYSLFITNRFLKIYPAYFFILFLTLITAFAYFLVTHNHESGIIGKMLNYKEKLPPGSMVFIFLTNFTIVGQDLLFFLKTDSHYKVIFALDFQQSPIVLIRLLAVPQAWSISLELMFYFIAPFLVKLKVKWLFLIALGSLALRIILFRNGLNFDPWTYRFFPCEVFFFILGILSYKMYRSNQLTRLKSFTAGKSFGFYYSGLLLVLAFFPQLIVNNFLLSLLIVLFTISLPLIFDKFKRNAIDRKIGDFSYELYICHQFCIYLFLSLFKRYIQYGEVLKLIPVIISIVVAYLMNLWITQKIDRYRQKRVLNPLPEIKKLPN